MLDELVSKFKQEGKSTVWHKSELVHVKSVGLHDYYECPFCLEDHYATVSKECREPIKPLHCHINGKLGWIDTRMGNFIKDILQSEETKFKVVLDKWRDLEGPIKPHHAFKMRTGGGCPEEIIRELVTDVVEYDRLMNEQKESDRQSKKFQGPYEP